MNYIIPYTTEEKEFLVELVSQHSSLASKRNDAWSKKQRKVAWRELTAAFNSSALIHTKRSVIQLKRCWDKLKRYQRHMIAARLRRTPARGEGAPDADARVLQGCQVAVEAPAVHREEAPVPHPREDIDSDPLCFEDIEDTKEYQDIQALATSIDIPMEKPTPTFSPQPSGSNTSPAVCQQSPTSPTVPIPSTIESSPASPSAAADQLLAKRRESLQRQEERLLALHECQMETEALKKRTAQLLFREAELRVELMQEKLRKERKALYQ